MGSQEPRPRCQQISLLLSLSQALQSLGGVSSRARGQAATPFSRCCLEAPSSRAPLGKSGEAPQWKPPPASRMESQGEIYFI